MFSGIIQGRFQIVSIQHSNGLMRLEVELSQEMVRGLVCGASVSVDGVCLTVTNIEGKIVYFDVIPETLERTTLGSISAGDQVNIERSLKFGDEVGGHLVSGHVMGTAEIQSIEVKEGKYTLRFSCSRQWMKYLFSKGFIAINGCSLTLVEVHPEGGFSVDLIPETLKITSFSDKKPGDRVNIEIDPQTQAVVETVERFYYVTGEITLR